MEHLSFAGLNILFDKLTKYIVSIEGRRGNLALNISKITTRPRIDSRHHTLECNGVLNIYHEDLLHPVATSVSNRISIGLDQLREWEDSIGKLHLLLTLQWEELVFFMGICFGDPNIADVKVSFYLGKQSEPFLSFNPEILCLDPHQDMFDIIWSKFIQPVLEQAQ